MPSRDASYADAFFSGTDQGKEMIEWGKMYIKQDGHLNRFPRTSPSCPKT